MSEKPRLSPALHLALILTVSTLIWSYWPTWLELLRTWRSDPDYNHGFFVIPVAAWLLWQRRQQLAEVGIQPSWWGLLPVGAAGIVRWLSAEYFLPQLDAWSIPLWVIGMVQLFAGTRLLRKCSGAIAFLWFMSPIPASVIESISMPLQQISAVLSSWTLHLFAQPAVRQGTTILLGEHTLDVERACSGLRICYGALALSVASVLLVRPGRLRSAVLIGAAVPVAILANSLRVTLTGLLLQVVSGEKAHQYAHDFFGLIMLPLAVCLLWLTHITVGRMINAFQQSSHSGGILLLKLVGTGTIAGAVLIWWQGRQADAALTTLLAVAATHETNALAQEAEGDAEKAITEWKTAANLLDSYCRQRPDDPPAAARLATAAEKLALSRSSQVRAVRFLDQAWQLNPNETQLGFKVAEMAIKAQLYSAAITATDMLLVQCEGDPETQLDAFRLKTQAMYRDAERQSSRSVTWAQLISTLDWGIEHELDAVSCAFQMAVVYHQHPVDGVSPGERETKSAEVFARLLAKYPQDPLAWFARFTYRDSVAPEVEDAVFAPSSADSAGAQAAADPADGSTRSAPPDELLTTDSNEAEFQGDTGVGSSASVAIAGPGKDDDLDRAVELGQHLSDPRLLPVWLAAADRELFRQNLAGAEAFYQRAASVSPEHHRAHLQLARLATAMEGQFSESGLVTSEQRMAAVRILKDAMALGDLHGEVLLRIELIRQQLQSGDPSESQEAERDLVTVRQEFAKLPPELGLPLRLNLAMIEAEIYSAAGDPARASLTIRSVLNEEQLAGIVTPPGMISGAWLALGSCYQQLGRQNEAEQCFQRAVTAEPESVESTLFRAISAEASSEQNAAADLFRDVAIRLGNRPEPWLAAARNELQRQRPQASNLRNLSLITEALGRARAAGAARDQLAVLEAEYRAMNGDANGAIRLLEGAATDFPRSAAVWSSLAGLYQSNGDQAASDTALRNFRETVGSALEAVLLESDLLVLRNRRDEARQLLDQALSDTADTDVRRLLVEKRVQIDLEANDLDQAQQTLERFAADHPQDLTAQQQLAEFLWGRRSLDKMEQVETSLMQTEGVSGGIWKELRARRLIELASRTTDRSNREDLLREAGALVDQIQVSPDVRPASIHVLRARIAMLERRFPDAVQSLETALTQQRGNASISLTAELIFALKTAGQMDRANQYLQSIQSAIPQSPQLFDMALEVRSPTVLSDLNSSVTLAEGWARSIGDAASYLRLARIQELIATRGSGIATTRRQEAETAFRKAIELDPSDPQAWGELIRFLYAEATTRNRALSELDRFLSETSVSEADRAFAAATLLTNIGNTGAAARYWEEAIRVTSGESAPDTRNRVLAAAVNFFNTIDLQRARELAEEALRLNADAPENKRQLLQVLLLQGTPAAIESGASIAEELQSDPTRMTDVDRQLLSQWMFEKCVLSPDHKTNTETLKAASQVLGSIRQTTAADQMRRARITELQGNPNAAMLQFLDVVNRTDATLPFLKAFVEFCQDKMADSGLATDSAEQVLTRIEQLRGFEISALELRLRPPDLTTDQKVTIAVSFLDRVAAGLPADGPRTELLQSAMIRLAQLEEHNVAMRISQQDLPQFSSAQLLAALLLAATAQPGDASFEQSLKERITAELTDLDEPTTDRVAANYCLLRSDLATAERLYRRCLQHDSADIVAANNLAIVLAEHHADFAGAERLLQQAEQIGAAGGLDPSFILDTRAALLLLQAQPAAAYDILKPLSRSARADGSVFLHLAECERQRGNAAESAAAFAAVRHFGMTANMLPPSDQTLFSALSVH